MPTLETMNSLQQAASYNDLLLYFKKQTFLSLLDNTIVANQAIKLDKKSLILQPNISINYALLKLISWFKIKHFHETLSYNVSVTEIKMKGEH